VMRAMTLTELQQPLEAVLRGSDGEIAGVTTDSRQAGPGDLFVALRGDRFDGHDFVAQVADAGAAALLVSREVDTAVSCLQVADTERALGLLGAYNRSAYQGPLVAITGSSGKTTVKNMVAAVLSQKGNTLATEGNFNNEIGVPLTLLRLEPSCDYAVVEMGAAAVGDIAWLCELGRPSISVLLNVMPAHLEGFGSIERVAQAKGEIYDRLTAEDVAIINSDQQWAEDWRRRAREARVIDFSCRRDAAVRLLESESHGLAGSKITVETPGGVVRISLAMPGEHNVSNALAAIAVGIACELSLEEIRRGLESVRPVAGRLSAQRAPSGALVIDDCYNANPGSVRAAIELLVQESGVHILVLGAMRELGENSEQFHRECGEYASESGVERLVGVGAELREAVHAFGEGGSWYASCEEAVDALAKELSEEYVVLVKGSRGARMERVLQGLTAPQSAGVSQ
jgi:UDP-N-acetylmuramoyl-tripeptide--D-alanyl-D-alanine ligase